MMRRRRMLTHQHPSSSIHHHLLLGGASSSRSSRAGAPRATCPLSVPLARPLRLFLLSSSSSFSSSSSSSTKKQPPLQQHQPSLTNKNNISSAELTRDLLKHIWPSKGGLMAKSRLVAALSLLAGAKLSVLAVPFLFKHLVDSVTLVQDQQQLAVAAGSVVFLYGFARASASLMTELRGWSFTLLILFLFSWWVLSTSKSQRRH